MSWVHVCLCVFVSFKIWMIWVILAQKYPLIVLILFRKIGTCHYRWNVYCRRWDASQTMKRRIQKRKMKEIADREESKCIFFILHLLFAKCSHLITTMEANLKEILFYEWFHGSPGSLSDSLGVVKWFTYCQSTLGISFAYASGSTKWTASFLPMNL